MAEAAPALTLVPRAGEDELAEEALLALIDALAEAQALADHEEDVRAQAAQARRPLRQV